jgi:hypothetical protein
MCNKYISNFMIGLNSVRILKNFKIRSYQIIGLLYHLYEYNNVYTWTHVFVLILGFRNQRTLNFMLITKLDPLNKE